MFRAVGLGLGAFALVLAFQNCNKQNMTGVGGPGGQASLDQPSVTPAPTIIKPPVEDVTSGGGNYDGKVWAVVDNAVKCGDGSSVISQIRGMAIGLQLERANCQAVSPPTLLAATDARVDASGDFVMYKQQTFTAQATPKQQDVGPKVVYACDALPGDVPLTMLFYAGVPSPARVIAYADSSASAVRVDSGLVYLDVKSGTDWIGRNDLGSVAFDLVLTNFAAPQRYYLGAGLGISVAPGGSFTAMKFDFVRTGFVQCRLQ